jgi:DNA helicase-2/ATP-dependent DNA helicase PcrA
MNLDDKVYKPAGVHARISIAKNNLIGPRDYLNDNELMSADRSSGRTELGQIYMRYALRCFRSGAMDFDDLLFNTNTLFRDHPEAMVKYQKRFEYVLVDEYQDTNLCQYNIVRTLAARHENLTVVGDDSQSIYAFRGANIQNILNFQNDYPDHRMFKLEQNYRSTKNIIEAANSIIANNKDQIPKSVWTDNTEGDLIRVEKAPSDNEEGRMVAASIFETKMQEQQLNSAFAILYRTNAQSRSMEEALRKLNIPYRIYGGLSFYQRKEVKDLLAYFRLVCNPNDEESFMRVVNYPIRGIGKTTQEKLTIMSNERDMAIWPLLNKHLGETPVNTNTRRKLADFITMIRSFQVLQEKHSAYEVGEHIARSTGLLKDLYNDRTPEGISRFENIQELLAGMKEFSEDAPEGEIRTLSDFLVDVALLTDADKDKEGDTDRVSLMTIHASKGLEFPYVYVVGMEENLFPNRMSMNSREDLEEERRLFYVAVTRAEKRCMLSFAMSRYRYGQLMACDPSRFIDEIEPKYLDIPHERGRVNTRALERRPSWLSGGSLDIRPRSRDELIDENGPKPRTPITPVPRRKLKPVNPVQGNLQTSIAALNEGTPVEHAKFGKGKVLKLEGVEPNVKATIFFPKAGKKQLLLRFAKLVVLEE